MCNLYDKENEFPRQVQYRRSFLKFAAASSLGLGIAATARVLAASEETSAPPLPEFANSGVVKIPPLPDNVLTPNAALERLMAGNARYVAGQSTPLNFSLERADLVKGQNPYACILSCSDSRVSPEFCFDEQRGDLFVARVAGNYLTTDFVATLEYAAVILHTPLIMVLGHESCGAIEAAINASDNNEQFPGHIQSIASALAPAVRAVRRVPDYVSVANRYYNIVKMNVILNVKELRNQTPILSRLVEDKKLLVIGGIYSLKTGKVELVA